MDKDNGEAFNHLAGYYASGKMGFPQDWTKANELHLKAGELGCAVAYQNLGYSYVMGYGVEADEGKAKHYYELAAMCGDLKARHNLACMEGRAGNYRRAIKHNIIAAKAGVKESMVIVGNCFKAGVFMEAGMITKDEFATTLRAHHDRQKEMKSTQRDEAAKVG